MTKKIIIAIAFVLCTILISTYSFATNEIMDAVDGVRNTIENVENGAENVMRDTAGAVKEGTQNIQDAGQNMTNDIKNTMNNDNNGMIGDTRSGTDNNKGDNEGDYTATRTANNIFGNTSTMWTWIVLAIIAAAIIGLVWYYTIQNSHSHEE